MLDQLATRRRLLATLGGLGVGTAVFQRSLTAAVQESGEVTEEMVRQAEWIAGIELSDEARQATAAGLKRDVAEWQAMRAVPLANSVPPAVVFQPEPGMGSVPGATCTAEWSERSAPEPPSTDEGLAFLPVSELAALVRAGKLTSTRLTTLYLDRLKTFDPLLKCVVTLTEELALRQAEQADREMAAGRYRGPLHGVPWGVKDLFALPGYPTTWGATPFKEQVIDTKATVIGRLEAAGAVLVAKTSVGALAEGDQWFGGMTRNPWDPEQGSSGSSAGSASAVAAGLVGFAIGTETLGSIVSPSRRCGTTGLRPTFGRVSRYGCMTLAWSFDKAGPIARSVEDCAVVLAAVSGADGLDAAAVDRPFHWPGKRDLKAFRVGYFEGGRTPPEERAELDVLRGLGVTLVPIQLPDRLPASALTTILDVEAATAFDDLTRRGVTEGLNRWPSTFRRAEFVPAVEYVRAQRIRTLLMHDMREVMAQVDLYVGGNDLVIANLTGHPTVVVPNGFSEDEGKTRPRTLTFTGQLFGETDLLTLAHAYQQATGHHLRHPILAPPSSP